MIQGRREFLSLAGYTFLFSGFPSLVWSKLNRKILILVELQGANDGLNTVIPLNQKYYYRLRPNIGIKKNKILTISEDNGLHYSLKNIAKTYVVRRKSPNVLETCFIAVQGIRHFIDQLPCVFTV